jgi:hypothetical protein
MLISEDTVDQRPPYLFATREKNTNVASSRLEKKNMPTEVLISTILITLALI